MDPSPKAWEAIMVGSIPIIARSTLDDAYQHLPVAFVESWEELLLVVEEPAPEDQQQDQQRDQQQGGGSSKLAKRLQQWVAELAPYYEEGSALRRKTLDVSVCAVAVH
jgi:hypothetical protein